MQNEDTSLQSSPQLVESRDVVALSGKQILSLYKKSEQSGVPFDTLKEVYQRGYAIDFSEQTAYNRVNSFISGGAATEMDKDLVEKRGLWDNIWAKRKRIAAGSGEHMRKPGSKGAPTAAALKASQNEETVNEIVVHKKLSAADKKKMQSYLAQHKKKLELHDTGIKSPNKSFKALNKQSGDNSNSPSKMGLRHTIGVGYYKNEETVVEAKMRKSSWDRMASALKKSTGKDLNAASQQAAQAHSELKQLHKNYQSIVDKDKANEETHIDEMKMGNPNKLTPSVRKEWREKLRLHHAKKKAAKQPQMTKDQLRQMAADAAKNTAKMQKEAYTGAEKVSKNPNDPSNRFDGTTSLANNFKNATPGQSTLSTIKKVVKEGLNIRDVTGKLKTIGNKKFRGSDNKMHSAPPGKSGSSGGGGGE